MLARGRFCVCVWWGGFKRGGNWEKKCWNSAQSLEVTPSNVIPSLITEMGTRGRHQQTRTKCMFIQHSAERCWRYCAQGGRCWLMSRWGLYHFPVVFCSLAPCGFLLLTIQGNLVESQLSQRFPFLLLAPLHWQLHIYWGFRLVSNLHNINPMANLIRKIVFYIQYFAHMFFSIMITFHVREVLQCVSQVYLQALVTKNLSLFLSF